MSVGDVFKMALVMTFTGSDEIVNTFHYRQEVGTLGNPAEFLATKWLADVWPTYAAFLSNRIVANIIQIRPVAPATASYDLLVGENGTHGSDDVVALVSAPIVTWLTGLVGRAKRGRVYLPPPEESAQDAGALNSTYKGLISDWAEANMQLSTLGVTDFQQVVWSETLSEANPVTAFVVRDIMGTQRRRKQGVGS